MGLVVLLVSGLVVLGAPVAVASTPAKNPFCKRLGHTIGASSGAEMYCFGRQPASTPLVPRLGVRPFASSFSANVDAASPGEDVSGAGVQAYGQSETSVAAAGQYVVEAWNDATGFFSTCPSPMSKEELTGYGFSSNGGGSFVDLGGLPNAACATRLLEGDPSVEAWQPGGHPYFYVASLYPSVSSAPSNDIAVNACQVVGTGAAAQLRCGQPVVAAFSTQCLSSGGALSCSFLDKDYLTLDPSRGRLYVTYTEFGPASNTSSFNGQVELAVCDIGTPAGGTGPAGGTPGAPVCEHGTPPSQSAPITRPYMTLAPANANCETEGSYPGVDVKSGDLYAAYEFNWATNILNSACFNTQTKNTLVRVRSSCLVLAPSSTCRAVTGSTSEPVTSMDAAAIPGYNRFPASDFPRVAADPATGTVSMVWNDARLHPLGDILLRSYALGTLKPMQASPVVLDRDAGGLHFLPAVRDVSATGKLAVSWYDRSSANTAITDVQAAVGFDPRTAGTPTTNTIVTSVPTDWNNVSSDIVPNFGDYTDNYIANGRLYVAWSDGRLGLPQPFESNVAMP
jgi:hypothetical protein